MKLHHKLMNETYTKMIFMEKKESQITTTHVRWWLFAHDLV